MYSAMANGMNTSEEYCPHDEDETLLVANSQKE
jgi:hypothetical protein